MPDEPVLVVLAASAVAVAVAGLGAVPWVGGRPPRSRRVGVAEALASGLMLGAAYLLLSLGLDRGEVWALLGSAFGVGYTHLVQTYSGTAELDGGDGVESRPDYGYKVLLQETLHSSSEGVAIGCTMMLDLRLGVFVVAALGLHNVAEGVALSRILLERGASRGEAAALCVVTKSSQVLFALAVWALAPLLEGVLSVGLGFASGCLGFLVLTELLPSSYQKAGRMPIASLATLAAGAVVLLEDFLV